MSVVFYLPALAADAIGLEEWDAESEDVRHGTGWRVHVRADRLEAEQILQALLDRSRAARLSARERMACRRGAQRVRRALGAPARKPLPAGCTYRARAQSTGAIVSVWRIAEPLETDLAPLDAALGVNGVPLPSHYRVACDTHGDEGGTRTLDSARTWAARPERWCWGCRRREVM